MNLLKLVAEARAGNVIGARTALPTMNMYTNGINPGMYIVIASEQKVGKSTFVLNFFLTSLMELNPDLDIEWNFVSTEMSRVDIEAKMISRKIFIDYHVALTTEYILGRKMNPDGSRIRMSDEHWKWVEKVYNDYVLPLSGKYDDDGRLIHQGKINWIPRDNPTGIRNYLLQYAEENGSFTKEKLRIIENGLPREVDKIVGYTPHNPNKLVINIIDHVRQLPRERGYDMKANVDKMSEYLVEISRYCRHVNVAVVHLNRWVNVDMLRFFGDSLKPTSDHIKDTGNLSEDASVVLTLMDPSDPAYKLKTHFGKDFVTYNKSNISKYRSGHIVENRYGDTADFRLAYLGAASHFSEIQNL